MSTYAVILAGGKGERFWPLSTARRPKQFLSLVGDEPLLAQAVKRLHPLFTPDRILVITNKDLVKASRALVPTLPAQNVIGEPVGRDTAAAVALAAALVKARDPNGVFCILTADHVMGDLDLYRRTLDESMKIAAAEDVLITIGIQPTEPSIGYGYIEADSPYREMNGISFLRAKRFVEKPDEATAAAYIASGRYFWNAGMFIWSVPALERAFQKHRPALAGLIERLSAVAGKKSFAATLEKEYGALEKISIDYALMEKAGNIVMARGVFAWDDVGSWPALENHYPKDVNGNTLVGNCEQVDARENIVVSKDRLTALLGVENIVVVQGDGVTLVCAKDQAQHVKKLVERLRASGRHDEAL